MVDKFSSKSKAEGKKKNSRKDAKAQRFGPCDRRFVDVLASRVLMRRNTHLSWKEG